ncbi:nuclear transport factor 2 family protein [Streptomyces griseus]|uniref:nuclear transport factor 2 family protein n=1 Tax=Streptomyces griseus TaxID=1911 RepID=UPI00386DAB2B|nr:nuclear transport factor 2 family protein [Streptomyces griseus]WTD69350.1 nuclear transport factor 2 family protein [Streptomyces griseus]
MSEASSGQVVDGQVPGGQVRGPGVGVGLYAEIQQFYARQAGLLDDGRAVEWARTFTEDGVFRDASRPQDALVGRRAIGTQAGAHHDRRVAEGVDVRHWLGMLDLRAEDDGSLRVRSYALTPSTGRDGSGLRISVSVVCHDRLVREDGRWYVADRTLRRDGVVIPVN